MISPLNADFAPQRYRERPDGFKELVTDEQEWLARPATWAIEQLPQPLRERKRALFNYYLSTRLSTWIRCDGCRELIQGMLREGGQVDIPPFVSEGGTHFREWYYPRHQEGLCEAGPLLLQVDLFRRGVLREFELVNLLIQGLHSLIYMRPEGQTDQHVRTEREWDRLLALELVGPNPFRPVSLDPTWRTSTAVSIAQQMYDSRDFSIMPILGDALQDAGCESAEILDHCRGPGPHVRGCWVVDLVLGES